ncbi:MAG: hypothetical protein ACR2ML_09410 [Solirubrobacteraceae bacterium]
MSETPEREQGSSEEGADVEDVERGTESEKGSMADEIERAQAREEEAAEG